jgi:hypothetical protein
VLSLEASAKRMAPVDVLPLLRETLGIIEHVHKEGIVNHDICAEHILVYENQPHFIDFSLWDEVCMVASPCMDLARNRLWSRHLQHHYDANVLVLEEDVAAPYNGFGDIVHTLLEHDHLRVPQLLELQNLLTDVDESYVRDASNYSELLLATKNVLNR